MKVHDGYTVNELLLKKHEYLAERLEELLRDDPDPRTLEARVQALLEATRQNIGIIKSWG